jgi:hypothetical protein
MSTPKVAIATEQYHNPVADAIQVFADAQAQLSIAKEEARRSKQRLVRVAVELQAYDAISVNVNRLRRVAGL